MSGYKPTNAIKARDIKDLIKKKISDDLFNHSYEYVGDLAETFSLLWPKNNIKKKKLNLPFFIRNIQKKKNKKLLIKYLEDTFNQISSNEIYSIVKILIGGLRVGVSNGIIREFLSQTGLRDKFEIDELWHGFSPPYIELFEWLKGGKLSLNINKRELFHSFMLANSLEEKSLESLKTKDFFSEFKWDGIRAQIIFSKSGKIYSRNGDNITKSFPDLNVNQNFFAVIDGELVIKKDSIQSFNNLQKRIGRKNVDKKILEKFPIHFIAYDILFESNTDLRNQPLKIRRNKLEKFITSLNHSNISLSPLINFKSWNELKSIRESSLNNHIEGVMLKNKFSEYKKGRNSNGWYKWKRNPFLFDFIIMYAQRGHGKRSSFFSDFTFGCWLDHNHNKLVPVGKSYSGFTNDELKKLDKWVRSNIVERFGPVRSVKPGLVIEVAFDNINFSPRHKSGVSLRFPRFHRIRWDKPIQDVCVLNEVKKLIN